jgi:tRNA(fMet)-specific endonuclease VapC
MRYLLDTDTCVDILRATSVAVEKLASLTPDDCVISTVTSFELFAGAANARNPRREAEKVKRLLEIVGELPFDSEAARRGGELRLQLERAGTPVGPYDLLIAAHALALGLTLVSANRGEFQHVPGLRIETWR